MSNEEMITRLWVAYEQLSKVHTALCKYPKDENCSMSDDKVRDAIMLILSMLVDCGGLVSEQ